MNILKLQDELKGVPDNALVGYVQNPTGQVPTYLALGELQRRKTMREKFQQQQAPQTTVAEDLAAPPPPPPMQQGIAMVAPQQPPVEEQGVASLPTGDMYNEQNFATGGIVAFADGGEAESNYLDSQAPSNLNFVTKPITGEQQNRDVMMTASLGNPWAAYGVNPDNYDGYLNKIAGLAGAIKDKIPFTKGFEGINAAQPTSYALNLESGKQEAQYAQGGEVQHFDQGGTSRLGRWWEGYKQRSQEDLAKQDKIQRLQNEYLSLTIDPLQKTFPGQPEKSAQRQAEIKQELAALQSATPRAETPAPTATTGGPRVSPEQGLPSSFTGIDQTSQFQPSLNALSQMNQLPAPPTPPAPGETGVAREGLGNLFKPLTDRSADYDALMKDEAGAAENAMAKYRQLIGEDKMRPQLEEKLKKMEERSAKQEEQAPWMALARAGLGMAAGKSQFALQNIAEGATMGLEDYNKAKDKLETAREKQFDIQSRLSQAQRAEDVAAATHGLKSEEFIKAQNQANKLAKLSYQTNLEASNQKNKIDAYEAITKNKTADITGRYYDIIGKAALNKTGTGGLDEDTIRRSYDSYLKGEFMDLPPNMTYDQFKLHTQGLAGAGLSPKAQSAYDKYKPK